MTLIIGAKFKHATQIGDNVSGVVLIADRKITLKDGGESWGNKIINPENLAISVCAYGYVDLFNEFNRKIVEKVRERVVETDLKNIKVWREAGYDIDEILKRQSSMEKDKVPKETEINIEKREEESEKHLPPKQYFYSGEYFLDDCRELIEKISSKYTEYGINPLEVIIAIRRHNYTKNSPIVTLHKINCMGNEEEIEDFTYAGLGSPYVEMFFNSWSKENRTLIETIQLATFIIKFIQKNIKNSGVGIEEGRLPQIIVFLDDGRRGEHLTTENKKLLDFINQKLEDYKKWSDNATDTFVDINDNRFREIFIL